MLNFLLLLKHIFTEPANRAKEIFGEVFPLCSRRYPVVRVAQSFVVDISAGTYIFHFVFLRFYKLFAEIAVQKSLKSLTVSGFVACHLVHGIVYCVKAEFFCKFCKFGLACSCAVFSLNAQFKVLFG